MGSTETRIVFTFSLKRRMRRVVSFFVKVVSFTCLFASCMYRSHSAVPALSLSLDPCIHRVLYSVNHSLFAALFSFSLHYKSVPRSRS